MADQDIDPWEGDAETVDTTPPPTGPPVDQPDRKPVFAAVVSAPDRRRPIVPATLRRGNIGATVKNTTGLVSHVTAYHALRTPLWYLPLMTFWALVGAGRVVSKQVRWWWVAEQADLRQAAATKNDQEAWMKLHREAKATRAWRGYVLLAEVIALVVGITALVMLAPRWASVLVLLAALPILARAGRPIDHPIVTAAVVKPQYRRLTAELVRGAIVACGIPAVKEPEQLTFPDEIHRDGPGQLAIVDLPPGVDAVEVIERRSKLASGLRVPLDQVWPDTMPRAHPGRVAIWVGYQPASEMKQPAWPLLKAGQVDIFKPFPFGTDPRLRTVFGQLMYRNWLFGAMPGAGKTFALRLPLLAAALDPTAQLMGYELKGTGDLDMLERLCTHFGSGADDDTAEEALEMLRWLRAECVRRGPIIKRMAKAGKAPENKVTRELASMPDLGLRPVVAFIDECQELFAHSEFGGEAGELATQVIKLGRALGIILLLATQRPDKDSLPKGVSANAGVRFCLRVTGQVENDMVLGTSMYKQGIRATMFGDDDLGWGWLVGLGKAATLRGYYVDGDMAAKVAERAYRLRQGAGTLPGGAQAREKVQAYNLLDDVRAVWPQGEKELWSELIVPRLQQLRPDVYADLTVELFGSMMAAAGVPTAKIGKRIEGRPVTRAGVHLRQLEEGIRRRQVRRGSQPSSLPQDPASDALAEVDDDPA